MSENNHRLEKSRNVAVLNKNSGKTVKLMLDNVNHSMQYLLIAK